MKIVWKMTMFTLLPFLFGSCIVYSKHETTGNPVGTKTGYVKSKLVGNFDVGIAAAAKQGKITKIGTVDIKIYTTGKIAVTVTGE